LCLRFCCCFLVDSVGIVLARLSFLQEVIGFVVNVRRLDVYCILLFSLFFVKKKSPPPFLHAYWQIERAGVARASR